MFEYTKLSNNKMNCFKVLNDKRTDFNALNMDFFKDYYCSNFIQQFFIRKKVLMLKKNNKHIGYIWTDYNGNNEFRINSVYSLIPDEKYYNMLFETLNGYSKVKYCCENNNLNSHILENSGFKKAEGNVEMEYSFSECLNEEENINIKYVTFKKEEMKS